MRSILQRLRDGTSFVELRTAVGAIAKMGLQGSNPEAHLVIEEEIDLVWKQVSMIHWSPGVCTEGSFGWFQFVATSFVAQVLQFFTKLVPRSVDVGLYGAER